MSLSPPNKRKAFDDLEGEGVHNVKVARTSTTPNQNGEPEIENDHQASNSYYPNGSHGGVGKGKGKFKKEK